MPKWRLGAALLMSVAVLAGCDDDDDPVQPIVETGFVRVVNASGATPSIGVTVDGEAGASNLAFGQASEYLELEKGNRVFSVTVTGADEAAFDSTVVLAADQERTFLVVGPEDELEALVLTDDTSDPDEGKVRVRIVHASPSAGAVDVYVTAPDADLATEEPVLSNVSYLEFDTLDELAAGDYRILVVATGTTDPVIVDSETLTLDAGAVHTLVVADDPTTAEPTVKIISLMDN